MSRNWNNRDSRAQEMRYNGRYPIDEMWAVRQSLIDDVRRNIPANRYLTSIDKKCSEYLRKSRTNRPYKSSRAGSPSKHLSNTRKETYGKYNVPSNEKIENLNEKDYRFVDDNPICDNLYVNFDNNRNQPTNSEYIIKEEPVTENLETKLDENHEEMVTSLDRTVYKTMNNVKSVEEKIGEESQNGDINLIDCGQNLASDIKLEETEHENIPDLISSKMVSCDDGYIFTSEDVNKSQEKISDPDDKILPSKKKKKDSSEKRSKSKNKEKKESKKCDKKPKSYKDFVKSVSKLVSLNTSENNDLMNKNCESSCQENVKSDQYGSQSDESRKKEKHKTSSVDLDRIIRNTRSSARSAKIHAENNVTSKKKENKKKIKLDKNFKKLGDSKKNSSKMKTRGKYPTRSKGQEEESDITHNSDDETEVTSTSKQKKDKHKRKSVSSPDNDVPLAKYSKISINDTHLNKEKGEHNLGETVIDSNCEESSNFPSDMEDVNLQEITCTGTKDKSETIQHTVQLETTTGLEVGYNTDENMEDIQTANTKLDNCLIVINESDSDNKQDIKQPTGNDLDSLNNNKDSESEHKLNSKSSSSEERLWEYLKCDFCEFLVSRKKSQSYELMEEHLETTKHIAASIVKVSINDGELKPVFVKKEHAILYSLEKASILPYCPTCCTVMPSVWTVQLHAKYKHCNQQNKDVYGLGKVEDVAIIPVPRRIDMCKQCGQRKASIQKHWKSQDHYPYVLPTDKQLAQYSCSVCQRHFETFFSALSHAVVHTKHKVNIKNVGVKVTYISKSNQDFKLLPREKTMTSCKAIELLNQAKTANKQKQWTRAQRKEFETMSYDWKQERLFQKY